MAAVTSTPIPSLAARPWRSAQAQEFHAATAARFAGQSIDELDDELHRLVDAQECFVDHECPHWL